MQAAASYQQTKHAFAQALQTTYTGPTGIQDSVAANQYYWFDQLFALMNSDFLEGECAGVEFEAYFQRGRFDVTRVYFEGHLLWQRTMSNG